jgi:predicted O-methyltransferase YrrM
VPRFIRNAIKNRWKSVFEIGQRFGFDLLPRHWYSSVPDFRALRRDDRWRVPLDMTGVRGIDPAEQFAAIESLLTPAVRATLAEGKVWSDACAENGEPGYGPGDADLLYAVIASRRPAHVMQIGCGVSTSLLLRAARDASYTPAVTCVDPFPTSFLRRAAAESRIALIEQRAEHVVPATLAHLSAGDLLFIDSSHTTKPGSDVHHLILNVLPRLAPGVLVHVHDIHWPYDFSPNLFGPNDLFFGAEPAMLHAYLIHNPRCRIAASLSLLHHADPDRLHTLLPNYIPFRADRGINPPDRLGQSPSAAWLLTE